MFTLALVLRHFIAGTAMRTPSFFHLITCYGPDWFGTGAGHLSLDTDSHVLLNERVFHNFTAAATLDIPHVLVADASMTLQLRHSYLQLTNCALYLPMFTICGVMLSQFDILDLGPAFLIHAHECQTLEYLHDGPWKGAPTNIHHAAKRTGMRIIYGSLEVVEAGDAHWRLAFLAACRIAL